MRIHCLVSILCVALAAPAACGAAKPSGGCSYHAGTPFQAEVKIAVCDHEVARESAAVSIHETIPAGGRTVGGKGSQRYVATLPPVPVHLAKDTIKYFDVIATVIIDNPNSADCQMSVEIAPADRNWAKQETTSFTIAADVTVNGRHTTDTKQTLVSCLDQDTTVLLKDGTHVAIRQIVRGDLIRNPVTGGTARGPGRNPRYAG